MSDTDSEKPTLNTPNPPPPTIQQLVGVFHSITAATNEMLGRTPRIAKEIQLIYDEFLKNPTTIQIIGKPAQAPPPDTSPPTTLQKEISDIKRTITALSKTVSSLQPRTASEKNLTNTAPTKHAGNPSPRKQPTVKSPHTYASIAATPACHSAVVKIGERLPAEERVSPTRLCNAINKALADTDHRQVHITAARWNMRGNLIVTAGHNTTAAQLNKALTDIHSAIIALFDEEEEIVLPHNAITIRANTKWSKVLLNRVPTGVAEEEAAFTPNECHDALAADNPSYAALQITQRPSWVRDPDSFTNGSVSSLSFAFEDHDGSLANALLTNKTLFIFGHTAVVKKWKQRPPHKKLTNQTASASPRTQQAQASSAPRTPGPQVTPVSPADATPTPAPKVIEQAPTPDTSRRTRSGKAIAASSKKPQNTQR